MFSFVVVKVILRFTLMKNLHCKISFLLRQFWGIRYRTQFVHRLLWNGTGPLDHSEVCAEIRDGVPGVRGPGKVLYEELLKAGLPVAMMGIEGANKQDISPQRR